MPNFTPIPVAPRVAWRFVELELISFSWEDRNALWFGLVMTFSPSQRACFKVLWDNLFKGNLPIPNERILCGVRGETTHIYHYFKRHEAWKQRVIVGDGRGNFWLRLPTQASLQVVPVPTFTPLDGRSPLIAAVAQEAPQEETLLTCANKRPSDSQDLPNVSRDHVDWAQTGRPTVL